MAYIGTSPSNGVRRVHTYTATANQTTFTGSSTEGVTLTYADTNYIDVFQNGVLLGSADYTSTSGTSVVLAQGASVSDLVVIVVYDVFSVADTVSKTSGGTFDGGVTMGGTLSVSGTSTLTGNIISPITLAGTTPTLTIGDAGAEDAKIVFDGNAQDYHIGLDDSADTLLIGKGSALGTTTSMSFDANGIITKPLQPAFSVYGADQSYSSNTPTVVEFPSEEFDINNDFNTTTDRFVAPVDGRYLFTGGIQYSATGSAHINFFKNGGSVTDGYLDFKDAGASSSSRIFNLSANDYIQLILYHSASGTTTGQRTRMSGFLIG
jgi:hypothetical protein